MKLRSIVLLPWKNSTVKPVRDMLLSSKKSPVAMFCGVMPMVGNALFAQPRLLVPVKNGLANVTALADVPLAMAEVLCSVRCDNCAL